MTSRTVDALLDERSRLVTRNAETCGHLWAAEFLLKRVLKLLPKMLAENAYDAVSRDSLVDEIIELLAEDREHPASDVVPDATDAVVPGGDEGPTPSSGDIGHDGAT